MAASPASDAARRAGIAPETDAPAPHDGSVGACERTSPAHSDVSPPRVSSREVPPACGDLDLAPLAERLGARVAEVLHVALQRHAADIDQKLLSLREDLGALLDGGAAARKPPEPLGRTIRSDSLLSLPLTERSADLSAMSMCESYEGADRVTAEESGGGARGAAAAAAAVEPALMQRRASRLRTPARAPTDLRVLEDSLADELFESRELVPRSTSKRRPLSPSKRGGPACSVVAARSVAEKDGRDSLVSKKNAWPAIMPPENSVTSARSSECTVLPCLRPSLHVNIGDPGSDGVDLYLATLSGGRCGAEALRQFRETELTIDFLRDSNQTGPGADPSRPSCLLERRAHFRAPFMLLRACGVLPWSTSCPGGAGARASALYQWAAPLPAVLACACAAESVAVLADASVAVGSLLGLLSLRVLGPSHIMFSDCNELLLSYADREGFLKAWAHSSWREMLMSLAIWASAVLVRSLIVVFPGVPADGSLSMPAVRALALFTLNSFQLQGLAFGITHVCCGLACMVNAFCCSLVERRDLTGAPRDWNVLQALLRKSCSAVERCVFVLMAMIVPMIMLSIAEITALGSKPAVGLAALLLPVAAVMLGIVRIPFNAAAVTDKCARVPPLVNSLNFGMDFDDVRQYVVEYIMHSVAGFYVFEVRLTSSMALKFLYIGSACAFAVTTRMVVSESN